MCGIVACVGSKNVRDKLIGGLEKLEYRGYDSAGISYIDKNSVQTVKCKGKLQNLIDKIDSRKIGSNIGIGHTRWATHGEPNESNAHPHVSPNGRFSLVHNGIIENYRGLKESLEKEGIRFKSETDTEVVVALIEHTVNSKNLDPLKALTLVLKKLVGAYAFALIDKENPDQLYVAKKGSPLVIGVGENDYYVASDAVPLAGYTKKVIYLEDGQIGVLKKGKKPTIINVSDSKLQIAKEEKIDIDIETAQKKGFDHFMLKEIYDQPESIKNSLRGRVLPDQGIIKLGGIEEYQERIARANKIIIVACGTSWHAGLVAEYLFEGIAKIPVEVEYASEFRYRDPIIKSSDIVIAISQSGETADTLAALELAKNKGALVLGICNVAGSSIARVTDAGVYTHAGIEISVASTKAFSTQVSVLTAMVLKMAEIKATIGPSKIRQLSAELYAIPEKIEQILKQNNDIKTMCKQIYKEKDILFVGRGMSFPVALEGALKLKEISYIHAEGYPAGELKHGPIALVDKGTYVVVIAPNDRHYHKTFSNMQELKARGAKIILICNEKNPDGLDKDDTCITVPEMDESLTPIITNIPLQILSYHVAVMLGLEVDKPRNLAKSVTVE